MAHQEYSRREVIARTLAGVAVGALSLRAQTAAAQSVLWNAEAKAKYAIFAKSFVETYAKKIDCADLAFLGLVEFAAANNLPIRLFDYEGDPFRWFVFKPGETDPTAFAGRIMEQLGAVNVIENTVAVELSDLNAGDLIMTERNAPDSTGHTRIVTSATYDNAANDWRIIWYQGTLPPALPARREYLFREMPNPYSLRMLPRRWNFRQFDAVS